MYKLSDDVLIHNEDDEQYLINSSTGKVFLLNDVAALIIKGLKNEMLINDINSYISAEFMEPTLFNGESVIIVPIEQIVIGEIILFEFQNTLILHRVVDFYREWVLTKGDNHDFCDDVIHVSKVLGKIPKDAVLNTLSVEKKMNENIIFNSHNHIVDTKIVDVINFSLKYESIPIIDKNRINIGVSAMANLHIKQLPKQIFDDKKITFHYNVKISNTKRDGYYLINDFDYLIHLCGNIPHSLLNIDQQMILTLGSIEMIGEKNDKE